jgi:hypothetical protein
MADNNQQVVITDIKIPFSSMVVLMVKWTLAAIPAIFILFLIAMVFSAIMTGVFGPSPWYGGRMM